MNRRSRRSFALLSSFCASFLLEAAPRAQQNQLAPESARSATVKLNMVKTTATGSVEIGASASTDDLLPGGESRTFWGWLDDRSGPPGNCSTGSAVGTFAGEPWDQMEKLGRPRGQMPKVWWVTVVQLEEARIDRVTLKLSVSRMTRDADKKLSGTASIRTVTLTPQQPYLVAAVDDTDFPGCNWTSVMVQLFAAPSSLAPVGAVLGYDLWLLHEGPNGARQVGSGRIVAHEGEQGHIEFRPFTWLIPGTSCTVRMDLAADIRGRIRANGLIDLTVTPLRAFRIVLPERVATPNFTRGGGQKTLTARENEAVEVVLPEPVEQFAGVPSCGAPDTSFRNFVDLAAFFKGQKTSLTLSVHKEQ